MKKIILPFFVILILAACEKESSFETITEVSISENDTVTTRSSNKRDVCHNGNIININVNAIPAHQAHGDAVDMDEDGFFDIDNPCSETDCDDTNAAVNPDASEEICNGIDDDCDESTPDTSAEICDNGIDDDCDGDIDEADGDCATPCVPEELGEELEVTVTNGSETYTLYVYPVDNNSSFVTYTRTFGNIGATDLWDGDANTDAIVADQGAGINYAAGVCANIKTEDCDWYLPARNELEAIYEQLGPNGSNDIPNGKYWNSTENDYYGASYKNFANGVMRNDSKFSGGISCRCVKR